MKVSWSRATPGEYTVRLRVRAPANQRDVETKTIIVGERPVQPPPPPEPPLPPPDEPTAPGPPTFDISAPVVPAPSPPVENPIESPVAPVRYLNPFPVVRMRGRTAPGGARLTVFSVRAPHGSLAQLRCLGRGCPVKKTSKRIRTRTERGSATVHFRQVERFLPAGIEIQVRVTQQGMVGKYARLRIRRNGIPVRSDLCLLPGSSRPSACP